MMHRTILRLLILSSALLSPTALACHNTVEFTKHDAIESVARADQLLARGRTARAYRVARRARRRLERHRSEASTARVLAHAEMITAVAVIRLDGRTPVSPRRARRHVARGREARALAWALQLLQTRARADRNDVRAQLHYAEALAHTGRASEARPILESLAERDLISDPHGYATLARLLPAGSAQARTALTRCTRMAARGASRICGTPGS